MFFSSYLNMVIQKLSLQMQISKLPERQKNLLTLFWWYAIMAPFFANILGHIQASSFFLSLHYTTVTNIC